MNMSASAASLFLASLFTLFSSHSSFAIRLALKTEGGETSYSYSEDTGRGPSKWGQLDPDWRACGDGKLQSPIDIQNRNVVPLPRQRELRVAYQPTPATVKSRGHHIQVSWKGDAGKIHTNGTDYKLQQCHWHVHSEHSINNRTNFLELHMVHSSSDNAFAVIAIQYKPGKSDPFLSKLLPSINSVTEKEKDLGNVNPEDIIGSLEGLKYYRYVGSLTSPPCTEGVVWTVFKKVRTVSRKQVQALRNAVDSEFVTNARPTQPLNGRTIYLHDS